MTSAPSSQHEVTDDEEERSCASKPEEWKILQTSFIFQAPSISKTLRVRDSNKARRGSVEQWKRLRSDRVPVNKGTAPDTEETTKLDADDTGDIQQGVLAQCWEHVLASTLVQRINSISSQLVADPSRQWYYWWLAWVSLLTCFNLVVLPVRTVFHHRVHEGLWIPWMWLALDCVVDLFFFIDFIIASRTGFLEEGMLVRDTRKLRRHYFRRWHFRLDLVSLIPTDLLRLLPFFPSAHFTWLRLNRLAKMHRLFEFFNQTDSRTNFPNVFRIFSLLFYVILIIHVNACLFFLFCELIGLGSDHWVYPPRVDKALSPGQALAQWETQSPLFVSFVFQYVYSFYWSSLTLTTIGETPTPVLLGEYLFLTGQYLVGVLLFASIVGNVGAVISNVNAARSEFQFRMDGVKRYMGFRKVSKDIEKRVIAWFDYLLTNSMSLDDEATLACLPDKFKAKIAMEVHYETLSRVAIFQDCGAGLLLEMVTKLRLQVYCPGDYICRKGNIGKEMYIVKRGQLQVVADDGVTVYVTLKEGSVFGELSILNIPGNKNGNRRTANVRSVGYSDLFCLSKNDLWDSLSEYPDAKAKLMERGTAILAKDNLINEAARRASQCEEESSLMTLTRVEAELTQLQMEMALAVAQMDTAQVNLKKQLHALEMKFCRRDQTT